VSTSAWQPLSDWRPSARGFQETLGGGQAFRWWPQADGTWLGRWDRHLVAMKHDPAQETVFWRALSPATSATDVAHYFGGDWDWPALRDALPTRSDPVLARAIAAVPGLRLLRQPLPETLLAFLCSATKQVPQIQQMLARLARLAGEAEPGLTSTEPEESPTHLDYRLPTWARLAEVPESDLRATGLGFRARYIAQTAQALRQQPELLPSLPTASTEDARDALISLPGVGRKIADCVLLFGLGRLEAFPLDTWIAQALHRAYRLEGWSLPQLQQFAAIHYGAGAGLAQQYLFSAARRGWLWKT